MEIIYNTEKDMYPDIIDSISKKLEFYNYKYTVFKTWKEFSPELKAMIPTAINVMQKKALPDITVVYEDLSGTKRFLIIEVKKEELTVKDIGQAKIYGDIFNADSVLLISLRKIPNIFIDFNQINENFLKCTNGAQLYLGFLKYRQVQLNRVYPNDGRLVK